MIKQFTLTEGTPMYRYVKTAQYMKNKHGVVKANTWVRRHVPDQLKEAVIKQL